MKQVQHFVVAGILVVDNTVLCLRRVHSDSEAGYWEVPKGQVEFDESLEEAVQREFLEETGLKVTTSKIVQSYSHRYQKGQFDIHLIAVDFIVALVEGSIHDITLEDDGHDEWRLLSKTDLQKLEPMHSDKKETLLRILGS